jgi:hypothetical protein
MLKPIASALLLIGAPAEAAPRDDVLVVVEAALRAVNTGNAALIEQVMIPEAIIVAQNYDMADDSLRTRTLTRAQMAKSFHTPGRPPVDERVQNPTVLIQRDLAHVWSPYTIDVGGKRLHCGIDSIGLAKIGGAWKLTSLTWTAEPNGCPK